MIMIGFFFFSKFLSNERDLMANQAFVVGDIARAVCPVRSRTIITYVFLLRVTRNALSYAANKRERAGNPGKQNLT